MKYLISNSDHSVDESRLQGHGFSAFTFSIEMVLLCYFIGLSIGWFILGFSYLRLFLSTPRIKRREISYLLKTGKPIPALSIIIPARNEERYIKRCLQSLLWQHYESFEIIMVDDNSTDDTLDIAKTIKDRRLKLITLRRTPRGWTGKSWASQVGYLASKGKILLFTDADTFYYNKFAVLETVSLMQKERVDVVTGLPLIELRDFYSKLIMPLYNLFSILCAPSYSDLRNSKSNVGYLIGSFFIINKNVMDKIGGFRCVQSSIQEDTDLGVCLKEARYPIVVIKISHLVSAFWSRNRRTLLEGIKRIVSYNLSNSRKNIPIDTLAVLFLIVAPFLLLPFVGNLNKNQGGDVITMTLYFWNVLMCVFPIVAVAVVGMTKYRLNPLYSLLILFGGGFFLTTYLISIFQLVSLPLSRAIRWKGRRYEYDQ